MSLLLSLAAAAATQAAPAPAPPPAANEREALAAILAENGTLATIGPLAAAGEVREMLAEHPELTPAERAQFETLATQVSAELRAKTIAAVTAAYAAHLSLEDLRVLAAHARTPAAAAQRAAMPAIMADSVKGLSELDFKGTLSARFCAQTGKLCKR